MHVRVTGEDDEVVESGDDEKDEVYEVDEPDDETEDGEFSASLPPASV